MTLRVREEQSAALRRAQIAQDICAHLQREGEVAAFDHSSGIIRSVDKAGRTVRYQLAANGKLTAVTTPLGRVSQLSFSDHGILTELLQPSGRHTQVPCDERGAPTRFVRNGAELARFGWNEERTESHHDFWDGSRSQASYSPLGKVKSFTNRLNHSEKFEYDEHGRLTSVLDALGQTTRFEYDEQGRPALATHPDGRVESSTYEAGAAAVALNGQPLFERQFDAANRPLKAKYADGVERAFSYDDAGKLTKAVGSHGVCAFEYREDGKLTSEVSHGQTFRFDYDPTGLLTSTEYPDGTRAVFEYDRDKRLIRCVWGGATLDFAYDRDDLRHSISAAQTVTDQHLDPSGKVARSVVSHRATHATLFETSYTYDVQDRLVARADSELGEQRYSYDAQSQLLGVSNARGQWRETFTYDAAGNRVQTSGLAVEQLPGNRLQSQGDWRCEYDERGNVVRLDMPGVTWRFAYDLQNQLAEADGPYGKLTFKYDALGRRIEKRSAERTIHYAWCGELLAREIIESAGGKSVRDYLYVPGTYVPLALRVDGQHFYYHNDHAGTPQRMTDVDGNVVWSAEHFAFGYAQVHVGKVENPLRFKGQYFDVETGLHYNRFRYYSPTLGRYVSVDPVGLVGGHNLYVYANNDPINRTDPLGLFSWGAIGAGIAAAAGAVAVAVLAPAALPLVALAVGAVALGAVIGLGVAKYQAIDNFCSPCFWKGAKDAAPLALAMGLGLGALAVVCAPAAMVVGIGMAAFGTYAMLDEHFGWSGGKPFDQMTDEEKSESLGGLVGGTLAGLVGGLVGGLGAKGVQSARGKGGKGKASDGDATTKAGEEAPNKGAAPTKGLDDLYGAPKEPGGRTGIKDFELNPDGTVVKNPTIQYPEPGKPPVLEPGKEYIWLVDEQGRLVVAEEVPTGGTFDGRPAKLGHPTLVDGKPARIGGEIKQGPNGTTINNRSGRFSGHPDRGPQQLENAAKLFEEAGLPVKPEFSPLGPPPGAQPPPTP